MPLSLLRRCELANPQPYNGKGELLVAIVGSLLWFFAIIVRLELSSPSWTFLEQAVEATSFVVFAAAPVFFLATSPGAQVAESLLLKHYGLRFQSLICLLLAIYIGCVKGLSLNADRFLLLNHLQNWLFEDQFWLNTAAYVGAVFVVLRIPFLFLSLKAFRPYQKTFNPAIARVEPDRELIILLLINFLYISLANTSAFFENFNLQRSNYWVGLIYIFIFYLVKVLPIHPRPRNRLRLLDLLLFIVALLSLFWFSLPRLNFGVFISIDLFILVVFYGLGIQREHFGYSFQVRRSDLLYTSGAIVLAFLLLVPIALFFKFGSSTIAPNLATLPNLTQVTFFLSYAILFSFRVGIFEEIIFRSGLMILIRDCLKTVSRDRESEKRLILVSAIVCSLLFGLCHIGNDPSSSSSLSSFQYKTVYAALATAASLFYSLAFGETNRLWSSIVIHGVVDTTAVLLLGAALTVPF